MRRNNKHSSQKDENERSQDSQRNHSSRSNGRFRENVSNRTPSNVSGVPILVYGLRTNFPDYKRKLACVAMEKFPSVGNIIEDQVYDELYDPDYDSDDLSPENDPHGLYAKELQERFSQRIRLEYKMDEEKRKLYGFIMSTLSRESEQRLMQS